MTTPPITREERKEYFRDGVPERFRTRTFSNELAQMVSAYEAALCEAEEENARLSEALTDCHEFFGQMYAHGIRLPHAGEQQLERVASCVAKLMESNEKL